MPEQKIYCAECWWVEPASPSGNSPTKIKEEKGKFIWTEQWRSFQSSILYYSYNMVIQITILKDKKAREKSEKIKHVYANEFVPCVDIGIKFEVVEGSCINYMLKSFWLNHVGAKTKGLRRLSKGHT